MRMRTFTSEAELWVGTGGFLSVSVTYASIHSASLWGSKQAAAQPSTQGDMVKSH